MGKYTKYNQKWIDQAIEGHLEIAVAKIRQKLPEVVSIMLVGGFGRGEGSVRLEPNQKVVPVNDYDIYLIAEKEIKEKRLNQVAGEIERKVGSKGYSLYQHSAKEFYFDIRAIRKDKLKKLMPLIKYFEIKKASTLVWGEDLRELIPEFKKESLPFSDGLRFLLNRICHITEWFLTDYLEGKPVKDWERETLIYDISKTYLECCTVLTLLKNCYQPTYQDRLRELKKHQKDFKDLWRGSPRLLERIEYFTGQKLEPRFEEIEDVRKTWLETRKHALATLEFVLREKYGARNWKDFKKVSRANYFKPYLKFKLSGFPISLANLLVQKLMNLIWFFRLIRFRGKFYWRLLFQLTDPGIMIFYTSLFIVQIIKEDGSLDQKMMSEGIKVLRSIYPLEEISFDYRGYNRLRRKFSDAWRLYYFQKII